MLCMPVGIRSNSYLLRDICSLRSLYYACGDSMLRDIYFAILMVIYCAYLINRLCTRLLVNLFTDAYRLLSIVNYQLSTVN